MEQITDRERTLRLRVWNVCAFIFAALVIVLSLLAVPAMFP